MISGCGRSAGAVIPALGSGRYSPGPNIVLPSWRKGSDPNFTINVFWGQPGALATVSNFAFKYPVQFLGKVAGSARREVIEENYRPKFSRVSRACMTTQF